MFSSPTKITLFTIGALAGILLLFGAFIYVAPEIIYAQKILPGTKLLDINLGGKTVEEAKQIIARQAGSANFAPLKLIFEDKSWGLVPNDFGFKPNDQELAQILYRNGRAGSFFLQWQQRARALFGVTQTPLPDVELYDFDRQKLLDHLATIAKEIEQAKQDPILKINGDRATEFVPPRDGRKLNIDETTEAIAKQLLNPRREVELAVTVLEAKSLAATNKLGINELLGIGESDFKGSPANRKHNISVGAKRFDGLIVKPGATFSFVQNLGEVDASTGYRPELVIKGDETLPEFGGGLCQVSTTAFRGILKAGLPVVERRNHSYRVAYYEPAGTDATIYQPYPDLKFKNDTPGHILIDTYQVGTKLYFEFYGTNTGRRVEMTAPQIFNVTDYPEPIYIDTSTIPVGETKQVDTAHRGADAIFYRKVFQDDKLIINDTFRSHYIPWPAKYLRGVPEAQPVQTDLGNVDTQPTTGNSVGDDNKTSDPSPI
jgi:vancomycin resistance protein YoaR